MKGITRVLSRSSVIWCEPARVWVWMKIHRKPIPIWTREKHSPRCYCKLDMEHYHQKHTCFLLIIFVSPKNCLEVFSRNPWENGVFVSCFGQVWYTKNLGFNLNVVATQEVTFLEASRCAQENGGVSLSKFRPQKRRPFWWYFVVGRFVGVRIFAAASTWTSWICIV